MVFLRQGDPSERQGELNFSLEYDYATQTLKLKIIQVRALHFPSYTLSEKHVGKENSKLKAIHLAVQENRLYLPIPSYPSIFAVGDIPPIALFPISLRQFPPHSAPETRSQAPFPRFLLFAIPLTTFPPPPPPDRAIKNV